MEGYEKGSTVSICPLRPMEALEHTLVVIGSHVPLLDEAADLLHLADPSFVVAQTLPISPWTGL